MARAASTLTRDDLEAKIVKRCWQDEEFRKEFTADPAGAFVKYLEIPAASLPHISVHQEEPGAWHIVLPAKPANTAEISEADLEKVAAGLETMKFIVSYGFHSLMSAAASASLTVGLSQTLVEEGW
jgi:hypothetical protein